MEPPVDARLGTLLQRFGLEAFRPGQEEVIRAVLAGSDVLAVMPTGGGKSLCYQLPSLARAGMTLVVSPLIALMQDQTEALRQRGIRATQINSSLTSQEQQHRLEQMASGSYDLVYVAPERMRHSAFLRALQAVKVDLLAVDEAHCVSEWGHDFRPDYSRIGILREQVLGGVQTIALTATATPLVREDICRLLGLREPQQFITGFARPNLQLRVSPCSDQKDKDEQLLAFLRARTGSGIIYAATRKRCDELVEWLPQQLRRAVGVYHAGLSAEQRQTTQQAFMSGELSAIVATNAFGMGVDKRDLRWVVHYNLPGSIEAYYQEAGRAGRDGMPSECLLLFQYADRYIQEFFIENRYPTAEVVQRVYEFLASRSEDPIELTLEEVRQGTMLSKVSAEAVGTAETLLAKTGVLQRLESGGGYATLRIDSKLPTLVDMLPREARVRRKVLQQCERIVGTRRGEDVPFRLDRLIERLEMERESVLRSLRELSRLQDFDFVPPFRGRAVHFRRRGVPFRELQIDFRELDRRKAAEYEKLESVLRLCRTTACRQRTILDYFGDQRAANCGVCDNCVQHGSVRTTSSPIESPDTDTKRPAVVLQTASQFSPHREDSAAIRAIGVAVLQAVARTHGRIGKLLTAQVLVGSQSQKLQGLRLHRTADFGRFKGLRQSEITQVLDQLLHTGLLEQREVNQHRPTLYITEAGQAILKEPERLAGMIRLPPPLVARASAALNAGSPEKSPSVGSQPSAGDSPKHAPATESADPSPQPGADQTKNFADLPTRVAALRRWRRETADQVGIPAYRVLPSNLVEELAARSPQSLEALERIPGLAPEIISQWGAEILEVLHAPSGLISQSVARTMDPAAVEPEAEPAHGSADSSAVAARCDAPQLPRVREPVRVGHEVLKAEESAGSWTGKLLADGYKWMEMLQARRLTPEAALADLETLADAGQPLDVQRLPTEAELRASLNDQVRSPPDVESLCQRLERLRQAGRTPPADGPERSGGPGRPSMVRQVSP